MTRVPLTPRECLGWGACFVLAIASILIVSFALLRILLA